MASKGIFFDLYGTLMVYGDMDRGWNAWVSAFHDGLAKHGHAVLKTAPELRRGVFESSARPLPVPGLTPYECLIRAFCMDSGFEPNAKCLHETAAATIRAWSDYVSLDPDAYSVLDQLRRSATLALITNFDHPPHVYTLLSESGLAPLFSAIVVSGEVGVEKPDPAIFSICLEKTGLRPAQVVHVGDSSEDVAGATAAGCRPILIARDPNTCPVVASGVPVISGLRELLSLL